METTEQTFSTDVIEASASTPVLVDFWAPWCAPCRTLGPVLERMAAEAGEQWQLVKVNTEAQPALAQLFEISSIPAVKLFAQGKVVGEFVGALPESQIREFLDKHIPNPTKMRLDAVAKARSVGDLASARLMLGAVLKEAPNDTTAQMIQAELLVPGELGDALRLVDTIAKTDDGSLQERMDAVRCLCELPEALDRGDLKDSVWAGYHEGIREFLEGNSEAAILKWLESLALRQDLDDGALRRACVATFRWLGNTHDLTQKYRRQFASALY